MFKMGDANFRRMVDNSVAIEKVTQKTNIVVDEEGSKAAVVTASKNTYKIDLSPF